MTDFKTIPLSEIHPDKNQPRKYYDTSAMAELTQSIKEKGVLQPILLRPNGQGYILVCGERRYRASKEAGLTDIPAVVRTLSDDEALELQIIENLQRKDVHPMEEAVAFKSLLENKNRKITIEEVAAKVAKTVYYVRQRVKLNSLSKDWQDVFYKNKIHVSVALEVGQLAQKEQATLFSQKVEKKRLTDQNYEPNISDWDFKQLRRALKSAPFDTKDETLNPSMGACTGCPFNSAVASLFPEDSKDPICNNAACYQVKCNVAFERNLKEVVDDPALVLIYNYLRTDSDRKLVEKLKKEHKVYETGYYSDSGNLNCNVHHSPDKKDIESGKLIKGFYIAGDERGRIVWVQLGKAKTTSTSKKAADKIKAGKASVEDILAEISRVQDREKRSKELDTEKIHKAVLESLQKEEGFINFSTIKHQKIDKGFMVYFLLKSGDYRFRDVLDKKLKFVPKEPGYSSGYAEKYFEQLAELSNDQVSMILRELAWNKYGNKNLVNGIAPEDTILYKIAEYGGIDLKAIKNVQKEISDKRIERVNKRIADLQLTKKSLEGEKVKPVKKAPLPAAAKQNQKNKSFKKTTKKK